MLIRERPSLRESTSILTVSGRHYRWADDEPEPANIPSGVRHSSTMPGGYESFDCTLPRRPGVDYADLEPLSTITIRDASGEVVSETRLERTPRVSGDQMAISPSAVGWQAHLEDDKSAREVYADRDMSRWTEATLVRKRAIADLSTVPQGKIPVSIGEGGIVWTPPNEALPDNEISEVMYDTGVGLQATRIEYKGRRVGTWTAFEAPKVWSAATGDMASTTDETLTLDGVLRGATAFPDGRYLMLRAFASGGPVTPSGGIEQSYAVIAVYGNSGVTLVVDVAQEPRGVLASGVVADAVSRWAPLLVVDVEASSFVIPHAVFRDPTTAGEIIRQVTRFGLQDWAVWNGKVFEWYERGTRGKAWHARIGPAQLEETGPQVDRLWESVIVQYQNVDGTTRTVGPVGSGADTETADLKDDDPENPANKLAAATGEDFVRRDLLVMGISTAAGATEVGRRFLIEQKTLDRSGRARLVGYVEDDHGVLYPYSRIRAGDTITFVDAADPSPRRIVKAEHDRDARTCSVDLDSPPEGLAALLERLGVVLVPLGL